MTPLSEDDYFTRNPEFSTWLRDRRKVRIHGLTARSTTSPYAAIPADFALLQTHCQQMQNFFAMSVTLALRSLAPCYALQTVLLCPTV